MEKDRGRGGEERERRRGEKLTDRERERAREKEREKERERGERLTDSERTQSSAAQFCCPSSAAPALPLPFSALPPHTMAANARAQRRAWW